MHPVLATLRLGQWEAPLSTYSVLLSAAVLLGATLSVLAAHREGFDWALVIAVAGCTVAGGLCGAYALFVGIRWLQTDSLMQALLPGGLVFYGALAGGVGGLVGACRWLRIPPLQLMDACVPAHAIGHALGRVGCLLGGCCYGKPWSGPWAVSAASVDWNGGAPSPMFRHPVALYEAAGLFVLAAAFSWGPLRRIRGGRRALGYLAIYAVLRIVVEQYRGDPIRGVWMASVSTSQVLSGSILIGVGVVAWLRRKRGGPSFPARPVYGFRRRSTTDSSSGR